MMSIPAAQRALVILPGALGDFLCFLPALRFLSQGKRVDLLARSEFADLVPPSVKVGSLERYEIRRLFVPGSAQEKRLRDFFSSYSSIFSWMGSRQSTFVQELSELSQGRACVFPFQPEQVGLHQSEYYLTCIGDRPLEIGKVEIPLMTEAVAWSDRYWQENFLKGKPVMALAPGSGAPEKNWPPAYFRAVADWWRRRTCGAVVVILGPAEEEKGDYTAVCQGAVIARSLNLGKLAALLARCDLYLGNDSGVSHLAGALGVVTAVLFGPSNVARWAPRGRHVTVVTQNVECAPCAISTMKSCPHRKCLTTLEPKYVIKELAGLVEKLTLTRGGVGITVTCEIPQ
ncbi:MAG TPA: glycosyltransferase family 9 protein [Candidatus Binatia bacterium]|nr:glycosyltransferase family 9 protein [Candidatus Binatia bacterium]